MIKHDNGTDDNDEEEIRQRLRKLLGNDGLAYADIEISRTDPPNDARKKHNARTARYKQDQALQLSPDSEAVRQATSNVLMKIMFDNTKNAEILFNRSVSELIDAGYDRKQSKTILKRLITSYEERRRAWQIRTRQKLARTLIKHLRNLGQ